MKTINTEKEYKDFILYFDVMIISVGDDFCIVKLLGKRKQ